MVRAIMQFEPVTVCAPDLSKVWQERKSHLTLCRPLHLPFISHTLDVLDNLA